MNPADHIDAAPEAAQHAIDCLHVALGAMGEHNKKAADAALNAASNALGGPHSARYYIRAAQCSTDIANWDSAQRYALQARCLIDQRYADDGTPQPADDRAS